MIFGHYGAATSGGPNSCISMRIEFSVTLVTVLLNSRPRGNSWSALTTGAQQRDRTTSLSPRRISLRSILSSILSHASASWATVCQETGLSKGTAQRALYSLPKNDLRYLRPLRLIRQFAARPAPSYSFRDLGSERFLGLFLFSSAISSCPEAGTATAPLRTMPSASTFFP